MIRFRPFHFAAIILGLLSLAAPSEAGAQYTSAPLRFEKDPTQTFFSNGHLELGLDVGTTGLGLELATPVTDWMRVRAGFNWMPTFSIPMSFNVMTFGGTETINSSNFEHLQGLLAKNGTATPSTEPTKLPLWSALTCITHYMIGSQKDNTGTSLCLELQMPMEPPSGLTRDSA